MEQLVSLYITITFGALLRYAVLTGQAMGPSKYDRVYAYSRVAGAAMFALFAMSWALDLVRVQHTDRMCQRAPQEQRGFR